MSLFPTLSYVVTAFDVQTALFDWFGMGMRNERAADARGNSRRKKPALEERP